MRSIALVLVLVAGLAACTSPPGAGSQAPSSAAPSSAAPASAAPAESEAAPVYEY